MSSEKPIIVVTGANRGIGFEICRQLGNRGATVILTARNREAGKKAVQELSSNGSDVVFHHLDVTEKSDLRDFVGELSKNYGHLDGLINNAGILLDAKLGLLETSLESIRTTFETNTLGPIQVAQALAPLLIKSHRARIINLSSGLGALHDMAGGYASYRLSKTALNAVTRMLASALRGQVAVNSMCPGWVRSDMGGPNATRDLEQGADTAVWLALDAPQTLTGQFLRDRKVIPW